MTALDLTANGLRDPGAQAVAQGVETRADFLAAHEMDFDQVQGYLFGKPMGVKKFARSRMHFSEKEPAS